MNVERLLTVVDMLRSELESEARIYELLDEIRNSLTRGSSPDAARTKIVQTLSQARSNFIPPSWREIVEEIGGRNLVGLGLASRLQALLVDYRLAPREVDILIGRISDEVRNFHGNLNNFSNFARALRISRYELAAGECEIGVLYPRPSVMPDLESVVAETRELDANMRVFTEIGGMPGSSKLRQINSSDLTIILGVTASVGAVVSVAINKIMDMLKKKYEIEKLRLEIEQKKMEIEAAKLLRDREKVIEEEGIKEASEAIIEFYELDDEGRRNELAVGARKALAFMTAQIRRGIVFEVTPSAETTEGEGIQEAAKRQDNLALQAQHLLLAQKLGGAMTMFAEKRSQLALQEGSPKSDT